MFLARWRRRLGAAIALGALIALAGCSHEAAAPAPPPTGPHYQDQRAGLALTLPTGFLQADTRDDPSVAAQFTLPGDGPNTVRATLSIVVTPNSDDLPTLVAKSRGLLRASLKDYQSTLDQPIALPSGPQGWLLGGSYALQTVPARNIQLFLVEHGTSYVVTGLTTKQIFDEFAPVFRGTFNTFSFQ